VARGGSGRRAPATADGMAGRRQAGRARRWRWRVRRRRATGVTRCGAAVAAVVNRPCRTVVEALREPSPHAVSMVTLKPGVGWVRSTLAHPPPVGGGVGGGGGGPPQFGCGRPTPRGVVHRRRRAAARAPPRRGCRAAATSSNGRACRGGARGETGLTMMKQGRWAGTPCRWRWGRADGGRFMAAAAAAAG